MSITTLGGTRVLGFGFWVLGSRGVDKSVKMVEKKYNRMTFFPTESNSPIRSYPPKNPKEPNALLLSKLVKTMVSLFDSTSARLDELVSISSRFSPICI